MADLLPQPDCCETPEELATYWRAYASAVECDRNQLRAQVEKANAWQPIETAPKDGTHIWAWQIGRYQYECWWKDDLHYGSYWMDDADSEPEPTYWRHLPDPPSVTPPSSIMEAAVKAAEVVEGWSNSKKAYADRLIGPSHSSTVRAPNPDYVHGRLYAYDATSQTFDEAPGKFEGDRVTILQSDFEGLMADRRELKRLRTQDEHDRPRWKHVRRGSSYTEICRAELQASRDVVAGLTMVVYRGDNGKYWVRHEDEFEDGRFEPISPDHTPHVRQAISGAPGGTF